ncbi:MAG TPA: response regulator [Phenylobacterium sp.]|jgi:CheY-like chemotaxis protein
MPLRDPYDRPLRIIPIDGELVFLGEGPVQFSMTPMAAAATLRNLAKALADLPAGDPPAEPEATKLVVLVVEDEPLVRRVAAAMLEEAGYAVIQADGPRQALLALEARGEIHLLFTDIQLPGEVDGLELALLVRSRWPQVGLLVTSGHHDAAPERLPEGGRFLAKPYARADVLREVEELVAA